MWSRKKSATWTPCAAAQPKGEMKNNIESSGTLVTDLQRLEFFQKLNEAVKGANGLLLSDWEGNFLASWRLSARPALWFTEGRRKAVDRMWMKLGGEINHPYPSDDATVKKPAPAALPVAERGGCMYFVNGENRQLQRCNVPATKENRAGFLYCEEHALVAQKAVKQKGGEMALRNYKPETGNLKPEIQVSGFKSQP